MESIYYVLCWACHRKCKHCYETRFRPYGPAELEPVVAEAEAAMPQIVDHLPARMTYRDLDDPAPDGMPREKVGRIILSGGEALLDPVRTRVTYPAIARLAARYRDAGGVKIVVQTTGDLLTEAIVRDLLDLGVWMISVAGADDFHVGMDGPERRAAFLARIDDLFARTGVARSGLSHTNRKWHEEVGPVYSVFGATPDAWIGKIWPRGRGWENGLSTATLADNFCNRWSGGLNFLNHAYAGSEVSIDPAGDVYPCCIKTKRPIGNVAHEPLLEILDSLVGVPAFEAISAGQPQRMGLAHGQSVEDFLAGCRTVTTDGRAYANLCIGCDTVFERTLGPVIEAARQKRAAARLQGAAA